MSKLIRYCCFLTVLIIFGCDGNQVVLPETTTMYSLNNPTVQEIFHLQDRRNAKELLVFFNHQDATYRYITAMALASIQDTTEAVIDALQEATEDSDEEVRYAAIYALGQTGHERAVEPLVKAFKNDEATANNRLNGMVLESIGKCAPEKYLNYLVKPEKYTKRDTLLLEGQSNGVYRFALRGITNTKGTSLMVEYAKDRDLPVKVRRVAANYLGRVREVDLTSYKSNILEAIRDESDTYTKMALVLSVRHMIDEDTVALKALKKQFSRESDYRVKTNILRVLGSYEYPLVRDLFMNALKDKNDHIRIGAAEFFRKNAFRPDVDAYYAIGGDSTLTDWRLKLNMLGAALANISYTRSAFRANINNNIKDIYTTSKNPYEKGLALEVMAGFAGNYKFLIDESANTENAPYVRSKAIEGLTIIRANPKLAAIFGEYYLGVSAQIRNAFKNAIASDDVGLISLAAGAFRNPKFKYKSQFQYDYDFLKMAQDKLKLPKEMEAYYDLQKTIDYIEGKEETKVEIPNYNHPINWGVLKNINETTFATLETAKGDVVLQFYHTHSPGSVANFVKLANNGFFNGKSFHRVVSNFVAQGGCPRGDGYGSLEYSIRSELSNLKYDDEGYVGMASAGKDTEGVQFFITHSPTPHLDGNYTIFAKVVEGMDVVHQLMVGDEIKKVIVKNEVLDVAK